MYPAVRASGGVSPGAGGAKVSGNGSTTVISDATAQPVNYTFSTGAATKAGDILIVFPSVDSGVESRVPVPTLAGHTFALITTSGGTGVSGVHGRAYWTEIATDGAKTVNMSNGGIAGADTATSWALIDGQTVDKLANGNLRYYATVNTTQIAATATQALSSNVAETNAPGNALALGFLTNKAGGGTTGQGSGNRNFTTPSGWTKIVEVGSREFLDTGLFIEQFENETGFPLANSTYGGAVIYTRLNVMIYGLAVRPVTNQVDAFDGTGALDGTLWPSVNGATKNTGALEIPCSWNGTNPNYLNARSYWTYTWAGYEVVWEIETLPTPATGNNDTCFSQFWIRDGYPADSVARLGFEIIGNRLECVGQQGSTYASIGNKETYTFAMGSHKFIKIGINAAGTIVTWSASGSGLAGTWNVLRTMNTGVPAWAAKLNMMQYSIESYRNAGTNDVLRVASVNVIPTGPPPYYASGTSVNPLGVVVAASGSKSVSSTRPVVLGVVPTAVASSKRGPNLSQVPMSVGVSTTSTTSKIRLGAERNWLPNPTCGVDVGGDVAFNATVDRLTGQDTNVWSRDTVGRATVTSTTGGYMDYRKESYVSQVDLDGQEFTGYAEFMPPANGNYYVFMVFMNASGGLLSYPNWYGAGTAGTIVKKTITGVAPAGARQVAIWIRQMSPTIGQTLLVGGCRVDKGNKPSMGYGDGQTFNWLWTGLPHKSASAIVLVNMPQTALGVVMTSMGSKRAIATRPIVLGVVMSPVTGRKSISASSQVTLGVQIQSFAWRQRKATMALGVVVSTSTGTAKHGMSGPVPVSMGVVASCPLGTKSVTVVAQMAIGVKIEAQTPPKRKLYPEVRDNYTDPQTGMRYFLQDVRTKEFIHGEFPLENASVTQVLSGPDIVKGDFAFDIRDVEGITLEGWGQWIHAELDGSIATSGLLLPYQHNSKMNSLEANGPTRYPHGISWNGDKEYIKADPMDIAADIWAHVQAAPFGNLGVNFKKTPTPIRLGSEKKDVEFETSAGEQVEFESGPWKLAWYEAPDCGGKLDDLFKLMPADYREWNYWNNTFTDVTHDVLTGYPRLGRPLDEPRFTQDENIVDYLPLEEDPEDFATEVLVLGAGEGRDRIRGSASLTHPRRLRRMATIEDKSITSVKQANALAAEYLKVTQSPVQVKTVLINLDHDNARLGTFAPGDDVPVQAHIRGYGDIDMYHRVLQMEWVPSSMLCAVDLLRSDTIRYGVAA